MIRGSFGLGRYVAAEGDMVYGTAHSWDGDQPAGVIFCHAAGGSVVTVVQNDNHRALAQALARHATVHIGDLGGNPFGNATAVTRIGQAIAYLRSAWAQSGPVVLVGISQGFVNAAAYALNHPAEVAAIAGIVPGIDLADLKTRDVEVAAMIDAAYPPAYNDATDGPTHSPIQFADDLDPDLPIHLFGSSNDPYAVPATLAAFVAARPQTVFTDIGPVGHTIGASTPPVVAFVEQFTY